MRILLLFILATSAFSASAQTTGKKATWYKGNLHTHSYWSDGDEYPEMIMDWYKSHGVVRSQYSGSRGKISRSLLSLRQLLFREYLAKFGTDWVKR